MPTSHSHSTTLSTPKHCVCLCWDVAKKTTSRAAWFKWCACVLRIKKVEFIFFKTSENIDPFIAICILSSKRSQPEVLSPVSGSWKHHRVYCGHWLTKNLKSVDRFVKSTVLVVKVWLLITDCENDRRRLEKCWWTLSGPDHRPVRLKSLWPRPLSTHKQTYPSKTGINLHPEHVS